MDPVQFEMAVKEIAFIAVLLTGCFCTVGIAAITGAWCVKALLRMLGLWYNFLLFVRSRKR